MHPLLRLLITFACLMATACVSVPPHDAGVIFVLVRHAEKADDGSRDPPLSDTGARRANALAQLLRDQKLSAVYATRYRRTQLTAGPTSAIHSLPVTTYDAAQSGADFVARLRRTHASGTVLIVGHSNTIPEIAATLCDCTVAPIDEDDFGNLYRIRIDGNGHHALQHERY